MAKKGAKAKANPHRVKYAPRSQTKNKTRSGRLAPAKRQASSRRVPRITANPPVRRTLSATARRRSAPAAPAARPAPATKPAPAPSAKPVVKQLERCRICFLTLGPVLSSSTVPFSPGFSNCEHPAQVCRFCDERFLHLEIYSRKMRLVCPIPGCNAEITDADVRSRSADLLVRLQDIRCTHYLRTTPGVFLCPYAGCENAQWIPEDKLGSSSGGSSSGGSSNTSKGAGQASGSGASGRRGGAAGSANGSSSRRGGGGQGKATAKAASSSDGPAAAASGGAHPCVRIKCSACNKDSCRLHRLPWDSCLDCNTALAADANRRLTRSTAAAAAQSGDVRANLAAIKEACKRCAGCGAAIEKNGGCNHMTCTCGMSFHWETLARYP